LFGDGVAEVFGPVEVLLFNPDFGLDAELLFESGFEEFVEASDPGTVVAVAVADEDVVIEAGYVGQG